MSVSVLKTPIKSRALGEIASKVKSAETFLLDNILSDRRYRASQIIDINYMYSAHRITPLIERDAQVPIASGVERRLTSIKIPRFGVRREISFNEIDQAALQAFGSLGEESRNRAAMQIIRAEIEHATNRLYRTLEQLLGRLISNTPPAGFSLGTIETHTANTNWSAPATNVVTCVREMKLKALRKIGSGADLKFFGIYNSSVGERLLANTSYINYFAASQYGLASISRSFDNYKTVQTHGVMEGVQLVQYDEVYVELDASDTSYQKVIPDNTFVLVAVTRNNALYWTHAPNSESANSPDLIFVSQENDYAFGRETVRIISEVNAFPFADADGIIIATIS